MTDHLLKTVLRQHCVTENQFFKQNSLIVTEARNDFIRRAYYDYQYGIPEICRVLKKAEKEVRYLLDKIPAPLPQGEEAAAPSPSPSVGNAYTEEQPHPFTDRGAHV